MNVCKHVPKVRSIFHPKIAEALQRLIKEFLSLCAARERGIHFGCGETGAE